MKYAMRLPRPVITIVIPIIWEKITRNQPGFWKPLSSPLWSIPKKMTSMTQAMTLTSHSSSGLAIQSATHQRNITSITLP